MVHRLKEVKVLPSKVNKLPCESKKRQVEEQVLKTENIGRIVKSTKAKIVSNRGTFECRAKTPLPVASQLAPMKPKERLRSESPKFKLRESDKERHHKKSREDDLTKELLAKKSLDNRKDIGAKARMAGEDRTRVRSRERIDRRSRTPPKYSLSASAVASKSKRSRSPERSRCSGRGHESRHPDKLPPSRGRELDKRDRDRERDRERERDKPRESDARVKGAAESTAAKSDAMDRSCGRSRDRRVGDKEHRDGHSRLATKRDDERRTGVASPGAKGRERDRERGRERERERQRLLPPVGVPEKSSRGYKEQRAKDPAGLGGRGKGRPGPVDKYDREGRRYKDPERRDASSPRGHASRNSDTWDEQEEPVHEYGHSAAGRPRKGQPGGVSVSQAPFPRAHSHYPTDKMRPNTR